MTEFSLDQASNLPDAEVLDLVVQLTRARAALRPVYDAATSLVPEGSVDPDVVPVRPSITDIPQVDGVTGPADPGFTASGVPTFDAVRDRIEGRTGRAVGSTELDAESAVGRSEAAAFAERERAAKTRLDAIRKSMRQQP